VSYANTGRAVESDPNSRGLPPVALRPDVMEPLERLATQMWPGAPLVPTMATGASDSVYTNAAGLPSYGVSGVAIDMDDVRAHGRDERLRIESFYHGLDFYYRYLKALTSAQ
jgi:acetylornithine deacetylase/succinyl-diaminopimelate desuccinylase-like protein